MQKNEHGLDCFPCWRYGPNGEARIFQENDIIPKYWVDSPKKVAEAKAQMEADEKAKAEPEKTKPGKKGKPEPKADTTQDDRTATLASLREAGVEIADNATDDEINAAIDTLLAAE